MTRRLAGFTLIELVVTVAIVGILASIAVPLGTLTVQRGKEQALRLALRQIRGALDAYRQAVDDGRIARRTDGSGYPPSLDVLADGVADVSRPDGRTIHFLRRLPRDPFDPRPDLPAAQTWGKRAYASPHDAPFEGDDVYDVYSRSERIGLNGLAYREW